MPSVAGSARANIAERAALLVDNSVRKLKNQFVLRLWCLLERQ
jgi:hypothetical protein